MKLPGLIITAAVVEFYYWPQQTARSIMTHGNAVVCGMSTAIRSLPSVTAFCESSIHYYDPLPRPITTTHYYDSLLQYTAVYDTGL